MQRRREANLQRILDDRNARRQRSTRAALQIQKSYRGLSGRKEFKVRCGPMLCADVRKYGLEVVVDGCC